MPRYYFDYSDGHTVQSDDEGTEVTTVQHARDEALETILAMAKDRVRDGELSVAVRDEGGNRLLRVRVRIEVIWEH